MSNAASFSRMGIHGKDALSRNGGQRRSRSVGRSTPPTSRDIIQEVYDRMGVSKQSLDSAGRGRSMYRYDADGSANASTIKAAAHNFQTAPLQRTQQHQPQHQQPQQQHRGRGDTPEDDDQRRTRSLSRGRMQARWDKIVNREKPLTPTNAMRHGGHHPHHHAAENNFSEPPAVATTPAKPMSPTMIARTGSMDRSVNVPEIHRVGSTIGNSSAAKATAVVGTTANAGGMGRSDRAVHPANANDGRQYSVYGPAKQPAAYDSRYSNLSSSAQKRTHVHSNPHANGASVNALTSNAAYHEVANAGDMEQDEKKDDDPVMQDGGEADASARQVSIRDRINAFNPAKPVPRYSRRSFGMRPNDQMPHKVDGYAGRKSEAMSPSRPGKYTVDIGANETQAPPNGPTMPASSHTNHSAVSNTMDGGQRAVGNEPISAARGSAHYKSAGQSAPVVAKGGSRFPSSATNQHQTSTNSITSRSSKSSTKVANVFLAAINGPNRGLPISSPSRSGLNVPEIVVEERPANADAFSVANSTITGMPEDHMQGSPSKRQVVCGLPGPKSGFNLQDRYNSYAGKQNGAMTQESMERIIDERVQNQMTALEARFEERLCAIEKNLEERYRSQIQALEAKAKELKRMVHDGRPM